MPVKTVFSQLEQLLPLVSKPIQYVGGELGAVVKDWDSTVVRWALMYPDAYEVGLPNQGVQILYEVLNEREDVLAERTYAVWPDLEKLMREHGVPQFTVDTHRPVRAFDLFGISFSTELGYTNMLTALSLAGIPLAARDRTDEDPIVVAGGHAAFNPEPIADFIDAAVLGDGEEAVLEITAIVRTWKAEGCPGGRDELLLRLARTEASTCRASTTCLPRRRADPAGRPEPGRRAVPGAQAHHHGPRPVAVPAPAAGAAGRDGARAVRGGDLPGLHRGCRFCQAGMITRPVRERSITTVGQMVKEGLEFSGFSEVGLLSLSSADHSEIGDICSGLAKQYEGTNVSLSLPSTRVDAFNITLAEELSRNGRRTGLTFAPEGGSERIRRVINKMVSEEDLIRTVVTAYTNGWRHVKLYFMCGLPTETDDDVVQIARLAHEVIKAGRAATGSRDVRCTVSIGGFVPKPHTPFQWASMASPEVIDDRLRQLKQAINADRSLGKAIGYRYHDGKPSLIEGLLARGDRRVGAVIQRVWENGQRFDGWSEHFSYDRWVRRPRRCSRTSEWTWPGSPPASATSRRSSRGTTSTRAWTRSGSGRTGRTPCASTSRTTAGGPRVSTAACARPWTPRSRSARPAVRCSR
jgi:radical SAM superfamily enzyme YgiQ (UPF0313 family)